LQPKKLPLTLRPLQPHTFNTLEALSSYTASCVLRHINADDEDVVTIRVAKPVALINARSCRSGGKRDVESIACRHGRCFQAKKAKGCTQPPSHLGSNLGDRFANIETALRLLEDPTHFLPPSNTGLANVPPSQMESSFSLPHLLGPVSTLLVTRSVLFTNVTASPPLEPQLTLTSGQNKYELAIVNTSFMYESAPMYVY
jgi:hypothetical protein